MGCTGVQVVYVPTMMAQPRRGLSPEQVEVFLHDDAPPWNYVAIGYFQEEDRDSAPGGKPVLAIYIRELAAEHGCDGVIVGGNVSRHSGEYRRVRRRRDFGDGSRSREDRLVPVFEELGARARCIVRTDAPAGRAQLF